MLCWKCKTIRTNLPGDFVSVNMSSIISLKTYWAHNNTCSLYSALNYYDTVYTDLHHCMHRCIYVYYMHIMRFIAINSIQFNTISTRVSKTGGRLFVRSGAPYALSLESMCFFVLSIMSTGHSEVKSITVISTSSESLYFKFVIKQRGQGPFLVWVYKDLKKNSF